MRASFAESWVKTRRRNSKSTLKDTVAWYLANERPGLDSSLIELGTENRAVVSNVRSGHGGLMSPGVGTPSVARRVLAALASMGHDLRPFLRRGRDALLRPVPNELAGEKTNMHGRLDAHQREFASLRAEVEAGIAQLSLQRADLLQLDTRLQEVSTRQLNVDSLYAELRAGQRVSLLNSGRTSVDPLDIPIFIVNFNNLTYLRKLIAWLTERSYKQVYVIDNNSTYPPLLEYYKSSKENVEVIRLERNFGGRALWSAKILERLCIEGPFVYTDVDIVPDDACPPNIVGHLLSVLDQYPQIQKVGPALRIDNLPETYRFKQEVLTWESQFWKRPVARGLFMAPIDTTFALYRPHSPFIYEPALRVGWPYVARHEPWYADSLSLSQEQIFYAATAKIGHWGFASLPDLLGMNIRKMQESRQTLLHLGCGHELLPGWVNLDAQENVGADIVYDLNNCATERLPLKNDSVDGFFMCHVFEHIENTLSMMEELHRVAKPAAKFIIRLPYGATDDAFEDPTRKRPYFPESFVYFAQPAYSRADYGYRADWQIVRVKLVVNADVLQSEGEAEVLERVRTRRNVVSEMIVELSAIKPPRPRQAQLLQWATPTLSGSALDEDTIF